MNISISDVNAELERAYDFLNQELFQGKCKPCMITVQKQPPNGGTLGWTTLQKVWVNKETKDTRYEINLCPEIFTQPVEELMHVLIHEMTHVYLFQHDEKERKRTNGTYHTKKFRDKASAVGLSVFRDGHRGWAITRLPDDGRARNAICSLNPKKKVFQYARYNFQDLDWDGSLLLDQELQRKAQVLGRELQNVNKNKLARWSCGCQNVRVGTKQFQAICTKCGNAFERNKKKSSRKTSLTFRDLINEIDILQSNFN
jgi:predicted SprT family Zn-dependent metalloprotease